MRCYALLLFALMITGSVCAQSGSKYRLKKPQYQEVDFEDMMRRYLEKQATHELEGIYSVSCVITKRNKVFLSNRERIRIVNRQDNYARVAILRDRPGTRCDFIEISLSYRDPKKFPVVGEINALSEGKGFIYNHIEPDGAVISFSMINESSELLEGEFSKMEKRQTVTYRLSYLKIYPKTSEVTVFNH